MTGAVTIISKHFKIFIPVPPSNAPDAVCIGHPLPLYRGIPPCCFPVSSHVPWFSPILPRLNFPLFSFETFLTIRQNSLYVTVCMIARTLYQSYFIHSLSTLYYYNAPSLATQLTGDYRDRTYTGKCGPALLDTRNRKSRHSKIKSEVTALSIAGIQIPEMKKAPSYFILSATSNSYSIIQIRSNYAKLPQTKTRRSHTAEFRYSKTPENLDFPGFCKPFDKSRQQIIAC